MSKMNNTLIIKINDLVVGYLTHYPDGKNIFTFDEHYVNLDPLIRPMLSMSINDLSEPLVARHRLPEFFSNLLPEGDLRTLIAAQHTISSNNEFYLLSVLGNDLPGAIISEKSDPFFPASQKQTIKTKKTNHSDIIYFSLAGVQLKFSMFKEKSWFTLAKNSIPGDYIIKTPSSLYAHLPENEYSMMQLAKAVKINVPETQLVLLQQLQNLPDLNLPHEKYAYAIKRFDRNHQKRIHIEDFAQVFNIKPQKKYDATNYDTMAKFIYTMMPNGSHETVEFLRRLFFSILIGNTDAHLKNWSLIYKNGITPALSPAYDFVSTLPYLKSRELALNFAKEKNFYAIDENVLRYFAKRTGIPEILVLTTAKETVARFKKAWLKERLSLPIPKTLKQSLQEHWKLLPLYSMDD